MITISRVWLTSLVLALMFGGFLNIRQEMGYPDYFITPIMYFKVFGVLMLIGFIVDIVKWYRIKRRMRGICRCKGMVGHGKCIRCEKSYTHEDERFLKEVGGWK